MPILSEKRLTFTFDEQCQVSKYDDWSFVRSQFQSCCGGSNAIDIICIYHGTTWLIEIKDYRIYRRSKPIDIGPATDAATIASIRRRWRKQAGARPRSTAHS